MLPAVFIILGIALLYWGGEVLVSSSVRLASSFGVSPLVIGLTVVAFATSSPELAATITATLKGSPDLAIGNAFGSNVANLGLILGLSALLQPLSAKIRFVYREVGFMVLVTVVIYPLMVGGSLGRPGGVILILLLGLFLWTLLRDPESAAEIAPSDIDDTDTWPLWRSSLGVAIGIALLVGGAHVLIEGATSIARTFGISERVIGLSLVALGTSLPELAACLVAARRGQADIVLGNVIGSNVFNLLCILGLASLVQPIAVAPEAMGLDYWVMLGLSGLTMVMLIFGRRLVRLEGGILLALYALYMAYLFS